MAKRPARLVAADALLDPTLLGRLAPALAAENQRIRADFEAASEYYGRKRIVYEEWGKRVEQLLGIPTGVSFTVADDGAVRRVTNQE